MQDVSALHARDGFAALLGIELVSDEPVTLRLRLTERHLNFHGGAHGGAVFALADAAFALASNAPGPRAVAIDTHLTVNAGSGAGDTLTAVAEEVARGRTVATYRVVVRRSDGRLVGNFTGTVSIAAE